MLEEHKAELRKKYGNLSEEELEEKINELDARLPMRYLGTLPFALNKQDVIEAETEWFQIQVAKQRLLNQAKKELLEGTDKTKSPYYQKMGNKDFIIKSGVRVLMSAFGISITKVNITPWERPWLNAPSDYIKAIGAPIEYGYHAQAWAERKTTISKNGQTASITLQEMVASGGCSTRELYEKHQPYKDHNAYTTAETRAKSRAALDMLSGDVSFEEI